MTAATRRATRRASIARTARLMDLMDGGLSRSAAILQVEAETQGRQSLRQVAAGGSTRAAHNAMLAELRERGLAEGWAR